MGERGREEDQQRKITYENLHKETLLCMLTYKIKKIQKIQTNIYLKKSLKKLESILRASEAAQ